MSKPVVTHTVTNDSEVASSRVAKDTQVNRRDGTKIWILNEAWEIGDALSDVDKTEIRIPSAFTTESITIAVADWSGLTATKTVTGVTAPSFNSICADKENSDLLGAFGVAGDSQDTDEITFKADETPTSDISLTIVIFS
jgi:hypothetical protein